jgi:hypothetical protein
LKSAASGGGTVFQTTNGALVRAESSGAALRVGLFLNKVNAVEVDENVNGSCTKELIKGRTSLLSPGLRAMAGWHDGPGV